VIRATDFSLTHSEYRIGSGSACRAKPMRGAASEMSPQSDAAPLPCGSAPFETHRGSTSSRCRERYQPFGGCPPVSAQQCGFGRGVASGPQVSVALAALRPAAPTGSVAAAVVDRVAGPRSKALQNQDCCGVARLNGGEGAPAPLISRCHLTDTTVRPLVVGPLGYR